MKRHGWFWLLGVATGILLSGGALSCGGRGTLDGSATGGRARASGGSAGMTASAGGSTAGSSAGGRFTSGGASFDNQGGATQSASGAASGGRTLTAGGTTNSANGGGANGGAANNGADGGEGGASQVFDCNPIVFADADFERAVRDAINQPTGPVMSADVAGLTDLTTDNVRSLEGAECLVNLASLDIGSLPAGNAPDFNPLAPLSKLTTLSVSGNPFGSLAPLGALPSLKELYLFGIPGTIDLGPLGGSPSLDFLDVDGDSVTNLRALASVPSLRVLSINQGSATDPADVAGLTSLQELDADGVFSDAAPLAPLTNLRKLLIAQKPLRNFSALASLVNLQYFDFSSTGVTSLAPLSNMPSLQSFKATNNQISDVAPLAGLTALSFVVLIQNQISDVSPLAGNTGIGSGDFVYLEKNALDCATQSANLEAMRARGASVTSDCP